MMFVPPIGRIPRGGGGRAFTLVELLVAMVVLLILAVLSFQVVQVTNGIWVSANSRTEEFRDARVGFESMTQRLSSATLNQYLGYQYTATSPAAYTAPIPGQYGRRSELRFISGPSVTNGANAGVVASNGPYPTHAIFFTAPLGFTNSPGYTRLSGLLNICGYYIQWDNKDLDRPSVIATAQPNAIYRFRLMQFLQPAENMALYNQTARGGDASHYPTYTLPVSPSPSGWQTTAMAASPTPPAQPWARPLADNVVALLVLPALSTASAPPPTATVPNPTPYPNLAPAFLYDTEATKLPSSTASPAPAIDPILYVTDTLNRLPPVLKIILYSIDEPSAQRLAAGGNATMPDLYTVSGVKLFTDSTKFYPNPALNDIGDLARFESILIARHLTFLRHEIALPLLPQPWNTQPYY